MFWKDPTGESKGEAGRSSLRLTEQEPDHLHVRKSTQPSPLPVRSPCPPLSPSYGTEGTPAHPHPTTGCLGRRCECDPCPCKYSNPGSTRPAAPSGPHKHLESTSGGGGAEVAAQVPGKGVLPPPSLPPSSPSITALVLGSHPLWGQPGREGIQPRATAQCPVARPGLALARHGRLGWPLREGGQSSISPEPSGMLQGQPRCSVCFGGEQAPAPHGSRGRAGKPHWWRLGSVPTAPRPSTHGLSQRQSAHLAPRLRRAKRGEARRALPTGQAGQSAIAAAGKASSPGSPHPPGVPSIVSSSGAEQPRTAHSCRGSFSLMKGASSSPPPTAPRVVHTSAGRSSATQREARGSQTPAPPPRRSHPHKSCRHSATRLEVALGAAEAFLSTHSWHGEGFFSQ